MGTYIFKLAFCAMLILFGGVAMFLGAATGYLALTSGEITFTSVSGSHTVRRAADAAQFWRSVGLGGVLPLIGGALVLWYGRRRFRSLTGDSG